MEEVKQSRIHLDMAKRIVDKLADGESHIQKEQCCKFLNLYWKNISLLQNLKNTKSLKIGLLRR